MRGISRTLAALVAAALLAAAVAHAEEGGPTRPEYVAQVEPICKRNAEDNERILQGARGRVRHHKYRQAAAQFFQASTAFGKAVAAITRVPRPPADDARLLKWFGFLRIVQKNLRKIGKALKEEDRVKAVHETIRAERSGNAANNVGSVFDFHECRLTPSRFN
jgi:hypothetical protein